MTSRVRGYPFEVALPEGADLSGRRCGRSAAQRFVGKALRQIAGHAPAALLDDARERLHALLGTG